jgi:hypothetical protein
VFLQSSHHREIFKKSFVELRAKSVEVEIGVAEDDDAGSIGVSEHGPELCLEEPIGNGSSVAVEVGI